MLKFEKEFLSLAGKFLVCRFEIMGGIVPEKSLTGYSTLAEILTYRISGEMAYFLEIKLLCAEKLKSLRTE